MAISTEITRLQTAKSSIKSAIENKGVTVPSTTKLDCYASLISQINVGGNENDIIERTLTSIENSTVDVIGSYAFACCLNLTTASFPECTRINNSAFFNCYNLSTISFPQCTSIGSSAFFNCSSLTTASFPECSYIDDAAFANCFKLSTVSIPQCTSINYNAFAYCSSLTNVSFPQCTSIGSSAFANCYNLLSLYLLVNSIPSLYNSSVFISTPIGGYTTSTGGKYGSIIVKSSMLSDFKKSRYWSAYSNRFSAWNGRD